ncbi:response regulator [Flavobacterium alkalisoli]|uniref:Response regulator n=1 Tax=Flavobacterium alkalisoli TaxID=2602769 RepID=A0A5B9FYC3_9FLAO|nr:response regulator [Flavobacterium alkalisoli]QEE49882.1 response regulator [Flavobacterium alkalisoli]
MQYRILLTDDDLDDRDFFRDAINKISNSEVSCITLDDGHILIATLAEHSEERPNIIFTDINMPPMSGWKVLSILKEHNTYKDIPVIMYYTSQHDEEIIKAKKLGALGYFNKPPDFLELQNAIQEVIEHLRTGTIDQLCNNSKIFF